MKLKTLILTTGVLVAIAVAVSLPSGDGGAVAGDDPLVGKPLLEATDARSVTQVSIEPENGATIELHQDDSGAWVLKGNPPLPANFDSLRRVIEALLDNKVARFVTALPERKERLDLDRLKLTLKNASGESVLALQVGRSASEGGVFVQPEGQERAYLLADSLSVSTSTDAWADKTPLDFFETDAVKTVAARPGAADSRMVRFETGTEANAENAKEDETASTTGTSKAASFSLVNPGTGEEARSSEVASLVRNLRNLRYSKTVASDADAVAEARPYFRHYELTLADGGAVTVEIGRRPKRTIPVPEASPEEVESSSTEATDGDSGEEDAEPKTTEIPAGTVYAVIHLEGVRTPWTQSVDGLAFEIAEWSFNQLPDAIDDLVDTAPPPPAESTPADASTEDSTEALDSDG